MIFILHLTKFVFILSFLFFWCNCVSRITARCRVEAYLSGIFPRVTRTCTAKLQGFRDTSGIHEEVFRNSTAKRRVEGLLSGNFRRDGRMGRFTPAMPLIKCFAFYFVTRCRAIQI